MLEPHSYKILLLLSVNIKLL